MFDYFLGQIKMDIAEQNVVCCPVCNFVTYNKSVLNIHAHQKHDKDNGVTKLTMIAAPRKLTVEQSDPTHGNHDSSVTKLIKIRSASRKPSDKKSGPENFKCQKNLKEHTNNRVHGVKKKFVCPICHKGFPRQPCLKRHTLGVHLGISVNQDRNRKKNSKETL
jgi:uncharacterized Zn-finger protein